MIFDGHLDLEAARGRDTRPVGDLALLLATLVTVRVIVWLPATSEMPIDGRFRSTGELGTPWESRKSQLAGVKTSQSMPQVNAAYSNRPAS